MHIVKISASFIFSELCTKEMLFELAAHPFVGYTQEAINAIAQQKLNKGSKTIQQLSFAKLRTLVVQKLQDNPDVNDGFKSADMEFEFNCLADPDINQAGANKQRRASSGNSGRKATGPLTGAYVVAKKGLKCTAESDPGKWEIWQHVWACNSFEEFFAKCPAKGVTKTGRVITARSEMLWAVSQQWVKAAAQQ